MRPARAVLLVVGAAATLAIGVARGIERSGDADGFLLNASQDPMLVGLLVAALAVLGYALWLLVDELALRVRGRRRRARRR